MVIDEFVLKYLENSTNIKAFLEEPEKGERPEKYYLIARLGTSESNFLTRAQFAVQSYAERMLEAAALSRLAVRAMKELPNENAVTAVRLVSEYNFTDTSTRRYRYQAVFEVYYYDHKSEE